MNPENLHLDELPFGNTVPCNSCKRSDLLYEALQQVAELTKLVLWIRCIYRKDFIDDHGNHIRKIGIRELTGDLQSHPDYRDYLTKNHTSKDPLDISEYVTKLIDIYQKIELAHGAAPQSVE
ncbi:MAG: hypothetical protein J6M64_10040 [Oscillospiraceae bacterium]|nr:hypothetical protein [Oscillospiraceae bacterium]